MSEARVENVTREGMRLDVVLARTRLVMPREQAKRACDNGIVTLNGRKAKAAASAKPGDMIGISFTDQTLIVRLLGNPPKSLRKNAADGYYEILEDKRQDEGER
jgi:ribosomal 50S subunit-recycling heat shock protein